MPTLFRVTLPVPDLHRGVHFYSALLGDEGEAVGDGMHAFRFSGASLWLLESGADAHAEPVYVAVEESLTEVHYRAQSIGAKHVDREPRTLATGEYGFLVRDPFDNALYVVDQRSVAWQAPAAGRAETAKAQAEAPSAGQLALERDFINAVKGGNLEAVQEFLTLDPELARTTDSTGISAMLVAAYKGHQALAEYLLKMAPHLNAWEAAAFGLKDHLTALLDDGVEVNAFSPDGFTALGLACFFGHPDCVRLLLGRGADPNLPSRNDMKVEALHSAVARAPEESVLANVGALIAAGADVNAAQQGGYVPLHQAADRGHEGVVRSLLEAGAQPDAAAANGRTPLDLARAKGHAKVVGVLQGG